MELTTKRKMFVGRAGMVVMLALVMSACTDMALQKVAQGVLQ